jgi:hypothetical protein
MKPVAYMIEGVLFVDIVNDQCGLTVFIEQFGDWSELFLPGRVPDLQFDDSLPVHFDHIRSKFDPDSDLMIRFESPLSEHLHQAALADAGIPNNNHFEQRIWLDFHRGILL